ncbi:hypothetical protein CRU87_00755 [Aliarcobacter trophiarum LMG 25534]|uniref:Uncharacterized protein n=1 Tax=Aliarcobacter trophiarum LMG 25534 TaxID=1032241 RepID=A0ABY0F201_9BACT|nr:hypothetical protein [Aliarcobacter trophiarum]RXJ93049.1 hypothetical protein CRU87_00755 [Aliarcobacter trophiarum LMG 25534]
MREIFSSFYNKAKSTQTNGIGDNQSTQSEVYSKTTDEMADIELYKSRGWTITLDENALDIPTFDSNGNWVIKPVDSPSEVEKPTKYTKTDKHGEIIKSIAYNSFIYKKDRFNIDDINTIYKKRDTNIELKDGGINLPNSRLSQVFNSF